MVVHFKPVNAPLVGRCKKTRGGDDYCQEKILQESRLVKEKKGQRLIGFLRAFSARTQDPRKVFCIILTRNFISSEGLTAAAEEKQASFLGPKGVREKNVLLALNTCNPGKQVELRPSNRGHLSRSDRTHQFSSFF